VRISTVWWEDDAHKEGSFVTRLLSSGGSTLGPVVTGPPNLAQPPPHFLDTVVLLLVELIGSMVI